MLASPEVGFIVPTKAMTRSGQKSVIIAKPAPVAAISTAATRRSNRREYRLAIHPTPSVRMAVPISVLVTIAPTASALNPSSTR
jgi:hypothetical protein